jgi:hypothetical protein
LPEVLGPRGVAGTDADRFKSYRRNWARFKAG